jgi:methylated-DNA-[protein]-cysteine S-methyltransferase
MTDFEQMVYQAVRQIPKGRVSTYARIARSIGRSGSARAVGNALNRNPFAPEVPCHRVVKSDGGLGGFAFGQEAKADLLRSEGLMISGGKLAGFKDILT